MYETAFDPNATVISSAKVPKTVAPVQKPVSTPVPAYTPAPTPVPVSPPSTAPVEVFASQAPAAPVSKGAAAPRRKFPVWLIIVIVIILIICVCVGFFLIIDQFSLWCTVLPWLVPLIGGTCV
jgi:hypothetical protein